MNQVTPSEQNLDVYFLSCRVNITIGNKNICKKFKIGSVEIMKIFKKKWLLPSMLILMVSLVVTGCTDNPDNTQPVEPAVEENVDDAKDAAGDAAKDAEDSVREMTYEDIMVTPEQAFDKFMELHPNAKVKEIDLDKELMEYQYVIEGYDDEYDYEVKINPVDGEIISDDSETVDMDDETAIITKDHLAKVDSIIEKAQMEDGSDSDLDEWNISSEDGRIVMDVEIGVMEYSYDMETEELIDDM